MKKTKLLGLSTLLFALGLAGCGIEDVAEGGEWEYNCDEQQHWLENMTTGEKKPKEKHVYEYLPEGNSRHQNIEASCGVPGNRVEKCKICKHDRDVPIPALTHSYKPYGGDSEHVPVAKSTCYQASVSYEKCEHCGDIQAVNVGKKLAHTIDGTPTKQDSQPGCKTETYVNLCSVTGCNGGELSWNAASYDSDISSTDNTFTADTAKFGDTEYNKGGTAVEGSHIGYSFYSSSSYKNVTLSFRVTLSTQSAVVFNAIENDNTPGYIHDTTSDNYLKASYRYGLEVNDDPITFEPNDIQGSEAGATEWFEFPCKFDINAGVNTIVLQKYGGYRATMHEFKISF